MTPEQIPNVYDDATIKGDAKAFAKNCMMQPRRGLLLFANLEAEIEKQIYNAYMRGMSDGFRLGWKIHEARHGRAK